MAGIAPAVVVVAAGLAAFFLLFAGRSAEEQAVLGAQRTVAGLLTELESARVTADLRAVGDAAAQQRAGAADAQATADPGSVEAGLLAGESDPWGALAGLSDIDGDNLDAWPAVFDRMAAASSATTAVGACGLIDGTDPTVSAAAGIAKVDRLIAAAEDSPAAWAADAAVAEANAAVRAERADLETYRATSTAVLDGSVDLRNDTGDFRDRIREVGVSYQEAFAYSSDGENDRRDLANRVQELGDTDGLAAVHTRIVSVITAGADAMGAAYDDVDQTFECNFGPFSFDSCDSCGWQRFQEESDRITGDFDAARAEWSAAIEAQVAALPEQPAPVKPVT